MSAAWRSIAVGHWALLNRLFQLGEGGLATAAKTCHSLSALESMGIWLFYEFYCPKHKGLTRILFKGQYRTLAGGRNTTQAMPGLIPKTFLTASLELDESQFLPVLTIFTFFLIWRLTPHASVSTGETKLSNTSESVIFLFVIKSTATI